MGVVFPTAVGSPKTGGYCIQPPSTGGERILTVTHVMMWQSFTLDLSTLPVLYGMCSFEGLHAISVGTDAVFMSYFTFYLFFI